MPSDSEPPVPSRSVPHRLRTWLAGLPPLPAAAVGAALATVALLAVAALLPDTGTAPGQPSELTGKTERGSVSVSDEATAPVSSSGQTDRGRQDARKRQKPGRPDQLPGTAEEDAATGQRAGSEPPAASPSAPASAAPSPTASPVAADPSPSATAAVEAGDDQPTADPDPQ